jgi:hypothetical protein
MRHSSGAFVLLVACAAAFLGCADAVQCRVNGTSGVCLTDFKICNTVGTAGVLTGMELGVPLTLSTQNATGFPPLTDHVYATFTYSRLNSLVFVSWPDILGTQVANVNITFGILPTHLRPTASHTAWEALTDDGNEVAQLSVTTTGLLQFKKRDGSTLSAGASKGVQAGSAFWHVV